MPYFISHLCAHLGSNFVPSLPALITLSDSGQDSSSPSTTPHTRGFSSPSNTPQARIAPALPLTQPPSLPLIQPIIQPPPPQPLIQPPLIQPLPQPLTQTQSPRVPPTPTNHTSHLGPSFPLSTPDVLAQGMTSVPPPPLTHPGLHPAPVLQSSPALIKVRTHPHVLWWTPADLQLLTLNFSHSNSRKRARKEKQTPQRPQLMTS